MKILYVTTIGTTMQFFKSFIRSLIDDGNIVDIATNETESKIPDYYREWGCNVYHIDTSRSPFNKGNINAVKQIRQVVSEGKYDIVHCHTPIAAMCTRIACRKLRKHGIRVFYTAHGFHFYKGAPLKNWLLYYPVEKICSYWTDVLITINHEDYALAQKKMKAERVEYVPGVGIDVDKFKNTVVDRVAKRQELGIPEDAFLLLSVGELNENKNHQIVIKAIAELNDNNIHYAIAGDGPLKYYLEKLAVELGVENRLHLLGYRTDVAELYKTADVFCFPSYREGLPVSVMEAMASGLPLICSNNRGTREFIVNEENGLMFELENCICITNFILELLKNIERRKDLGINAQRTVKKCDIKYINGLMKEIYFNI